MDVKILNYELFDNNKPESYIDEIQVNYITINSLSYYDPKEFTYYFLKKYAEKKIQINPTVYQIDRYNPIQFYYISINNIKFNIPIDFYAMQELKQLKQTFTSKRDNLIEIVETEITGRHPQDVRHYIKVNGVHQQEAYNTNQLIEIMK